MVALDGWRQRDRNADVLIGYGLLIAGFLGAGALVLSGKATTMISTLIFVAIDIPGFCVAALVFLAGTVAMYAVSPSIPVWFRIPAIKPCHVALVALVLMVVLIGPVYRGFALSLDEYLTRFQAEIFAAGRLAGEVPPEWRDFGRALHHRFIRFDAGTGLVYSLYRPGMAALYALFDSAGIGLYTSAILSAGSIILVASVARQLWPRNDTAPLVAALILATSQQVLITGLTSYAMSAHLFFNLLWLRLFFLDRPWAHVLAAIVGVAASALHQAHVQVFFAAPFLLSLFRPYRPWLLLLYGSTYALGLAAIIEWDKIAAVAAVAGASPGGMAETGYGFLERVERMFRVPGSFEVSTITVQIVRFFGWQNLVLVPLLVVATRHADWSKPMRLLAASIAFSLLPYIFLMPDQGHGWGYRYLHGLIGNFALLATAGWLVVEKMADRERHRTIRSLLVVGVLSLILMLPMRLFQAERLVAPFSTAYQFVSTVDTDVVVIDTPSIYYGQDLLRNRPFLENRPVLIDLRHLSQAQIRSICQAHPHAVRVVDGDELVSFGMVKLEIPFEAPSDREQMLKLLSSSPCT